MDDVFSPGTAMLIDIKNANVLHGRFRQKRLSSDH